MPQPTTPETVLRSFLYGGAAMLLAFDVFFLVKALFTDNFVPIVPIVAGIFTAVGLLLIVYAEGKAREQDKMEHRRISRVAHQLESPLMALEEDLAGLILEADGLPAQARMKLKHMETKTRVLLENVRDVFLMLQVNEGTLGRERRVYDACGLVKEVVERQRPVAAARNVELVAQFKCETAPVSVDKQLLLIALTHLIENAVLYTETPGMVNVVVRQHKRSGRRANQVRIIVQDRGIGISGDEADIIFQPFARGQRAANYDVDGIGVGLTLSRAIVREFGGSLRWYNRPRGAGAEFEMVLPVVSSK